MTDFSDHLPSASASCYFSNLLWLFILFHLFRDPKIGYNIWQRKTQDVIIWWIILDDHIGKYALFALKKAANCPYMDSRDFFLSLSNETKNIKQTMSVTRAEGNQVNYYKIDSTGQLFFEKIYYRIQEWFKSIWPWWPIYSFQESLNFLARLEAYNRKKQGTQTALWYFNVHVALGQ